MEMERNNERYVPRRKERPPNYVAQDRNEMGDTGIQNTSSRDNRNINREEGVNFVISLLLKYTIPVLTV